jgi:hypothetical protein
MSLSHTAPSAEDPISLYAPRLFWAFGWYLRWFFWRNFHAVRIPRDGSADRLQSPGTS